MTMSCDVRSSPTESSAPNGTAVRSMSGSAQCRRRSSGVGSSRQSSNERRGVARSGSSTRSASSVSERGASARATSAATPGSTSAANIPSESTSSVSDVRCQRRSGDSVTSAVHDAGASPGSSQRAITRRSAGELANSERSGDSRRLQRVRSSTTSSVRWAADVGVADGVRRPADRWAQAAMSLRVTSTIGPSSTRRWGNHFAQSHSPSRSGVVAITTSRSAGPWAVVASTRMVRASAVRSASPPVIATARSVKRSISTTSASPAGPSRIPIGMTNAPGLPGRRCHSVGRAAVASRIASIAGSLGGPPERSGGRLNGTVPSGSGGRRRRGPDGGSRSMTNARLSMVRTPSFQTTFERTGEPARRTDESRRSADAAAPTLTTRSGATVISSAGSSTVAKPSSSALTRRPGPIR